MGNTHSKKNEVCYIINKNDMKIHNLKLLEKNVKSKFKYFLISNTLSKKLNDIDFTLNYKDNLKGYNISMDISAINKGMNTFDEVFYNKIEKEEFVDYVNNFENGISIKLRCDRLTLQPRYIVIEYGR
tara:strand:+ start:676 stop:1059 length:384 start_codon:yes stop_codon:yes gene_type:complete